MALVIVCFSILHLLDYDINCHFLKHLIPIDSLHGLFIFQIAFTGTGEGGDKVPNGHHKTSWYRWQGVTVISCSGHKTADLYKTFALLGPKNIFYFITQPHTCYGAQNRTAVWFGFECTLYLCFLLLHDIYEAWQVNMRRIGWFSFRASK